MKNITMKEIKESGATFGKYLGFDIDGRLEADEVVLTARVMLEENSDAYIHVAEVSAEKMKEAKDALKEELKKIDFNVAEIIELAQRLDVVNITVEELSEAVDAYNAAPVVNKTEEATATLYIEALDQTVDATPEVIERERKIKEETNNEMQKYLASLKKRSSNDEEHEEQDNEALDDAVEVAHVEAIEEDAKRTRIAQFAIECAQASQEAEEAQDAALIDAEQQNTTEEHTATQSNKLHTPELSLIIDTTDELDEAQRAEEYKRLFVDAYTKLHAKKQTKTRGRVSNLAVVNTELKSNAGTARGEAARIKVGEDAMAHMNCHSITFERRGKYADWYISGVDADGEKFTQRLDAFKKTLKNVMESTK